jgi:toxin ParE1/3/4
LKLRYSTRALADLSSITDYLLERSPKGAARVTSAIEAAVENIAAFPSLGRLQSTGGVRKVTLGRHPYDIFYVLDDTALEVSVLTIRHSARARDFGETP